MAAIASPDHSRWPPRYLSAARTLQPTSAAICAAVFVGQSVEAMSERTEPTIWSSGRPGGRPVSVDDCAAAADAVRMTKRPQALLISIELATRLRNAMLWPRLRQNGKFGNHDSGLCRTRDGCKTSVPSELSGRSHGQRDFRPASSHAGSFFHGIQIRSQFASGNTGDALDIEYAQRWDLLPLRNSLLLDAERFREPGEAAGCFDGAFQWRV